GYPILGELPAKNIDTGLGLERTAALLQGVENIYEIDTTRHILNKASEITGVKYGKENASDISLRVIADHARTAAMLIGDGVTPGNEGRGYVLRRMMRRTTRNMRLLGSQDRNMKELIVASMEAMGPQYPELVSDQDRIIKVAIAEEEAFLQTLKSGTQIFDQASSAVKKLGGKQLSGDDVFKLHDTYGFPFDLTLEMASEQGLAIDADGFKRLMKEQRDRAKADAKAKKSGHTDVSEYRKIAELGKKLEFVGYNHFQTESKVLGILLDGKVASHANEGDEVEVILDRTPFYAEGGGQLADGGLIKAHDGSLIEIDDVQAPIQVSLSIEEELDGVHGNLVWRCMPRLIWREDEEYQEHTPQPTWFIKLSVKFSARPQRKLVQRTHLEDSDLISLQLARFRLQL
ncbi:MAG: hypothetical protein RLZZ291_345, partial [Actinomycetota bacterium]